MTRSLSLFLSTFLVVPCICEASLDLGVKDTGVSIGNSRLWHGLRLNLVDKNVEQIDGVSVVLGAWANNEKARYRGLSCGLLRVKGHSFDGVNVATFDIQASGPVRGLTLGQGAQCESLSGVSVGLVGGFAREHVSGINIGGIAVTVSNFEPGAVHVRGQIRGLTVGGGFVGSTGSISGVTGSALFIVADGPIRGVTSAGLLVISEHEDVTGLSFGGLGVGATRARGVNLGIGFVTADELKGLAVASYVAAGQASGLTIAAFNRVDRLQGVELGLLNFAGNNSGWRRWLPIVNAHF